MDMREIELKCEILKNYNETDRNEIYALDEYCQGMYSFENGYEYLEKALELFKQGDYVYYDNVLSYRDLAEMFVNEGWFSDIPEHLEKYIDIDAIANDLMYEYEKLSTGMIRVD
ncbi:MAG: antirestriction protein ArdA [Lachnospiraceae bacterium]|nr:antirestriction protein ArdA [Lachnospiraceae bacterium]